MNGPIVKPVSDHPIRISGPAYEVLRKLSFETRSPKVSVASQAILTYGEKVVGQGSGRRAVR